MKGVFQLLGALLLIQGVGGVINRLAGGGPSWFLVNYLDFLRGWEIPASIALCVLGAVIGGGGLLAARR